MNSKWKGDIAEQAVALQCLRKGWQVLKPLGDRSAYDLVVDVKGTLIKLQVKSAWFSQKTGNYVIDNRRTKTNRRRMIRATYCSDDFDFAVLYISELDISYVIPVEEFCKYGSEIHLVEAEKRQRRPGSYRFRDAWSLVESFRRDQFRPAVLLREKLSCSTRRS